MIAKKRFSSTQLRVGRRQEGGGHRIQQANRRRKQGHVDARNLLVGRGRRDVHRQLGGRRERIPTRRCSSARRSRRLKPLKGQLPFFPIFHDAIPFLSKIDPKIKLFH